MGCGNPASEAAQCSPMMGSDLLKSLLTTEPVSKDSRDRLSWKPSLPVFAVLLPALKPFPWSDLGFPSLQALCCHPGEERASWQCHSAMGS